MAKKKPPAKAITTEDAMRIGGLLQLDAIADVVLRYRPKPKSKPAKERRKKRRKLQKEKEK
jgi:hypothetical protein